MITIIIVMRNALSNAVQCIEHHNMFMLVSATPCLPCPSVITLLPEPQHDFTQQDDFEEDKFDCLLIIEPVSRKTVPWWDFGYFLYVTEYFHNPKFQNQAFRGF